MSENNQNTPVTGGEKREQNAQKNGNGQNRRNRNRHHKGGNRPRPDAPAREELTSQNHSTGNKDEQNTQGNVKSNGSAEKRQNDNRQNSNNGNRRNGKPQGKGHNDRGGDRAGRSGHARRSTESRPYDPYEAPSKQEIELSELRAQIVLKSADGTAPTVYGATQTAKPVEAEATKEEQADTLPLSPAPEEPTPITENAKKVEIVGVRFRSAGKTYYFDPHGIKAQKGECVIVETTRGPEFGDVCIGNTMINASDTVSPLRPLIRLATPADIARNAENREKEKEALAICQQKIRAHGLEMKLIDVQYAFDGSKILFYFSAEGRVDFRELVKDLASVFRTRIELRQIGIRDEAKMLGGIGACGRALCCSTFLPDFAQVSIKMAKDQSLSLNSAKISGVCGRLMCCLRYENEVYVEEIRKTPSNDTLVRTEDGVGVVIGSNPLAGTVRVLLKDSPDTAPNQYHRDSVTVLGKEKRGASDDKNNAEK